MKNKNYSEILKQAIKNSGYSQHNIAKVLNVSEMTLSNWTRMPYPPLEAIEMICKYLYVSSSVADSFRMSIQPMRFRN